MRLLPVRPDHGGSCAARQTQRPLRQRDRRRYVRQPLPLRHLSTYPRRRASRRQDREQLRGGEAMTAQNLSRRMFIQTAAAAGGGLMLGFHIPLAKAATTDPKPLTKMPEGVEINAWLSIDPKGVVTIRVPHTEMGQGGMTSVAMLIAEELDVEWSKIQTVFADANRHIRNNKEYIVMSTHGSQLVRLQHPHLMQAGASARERLKEAAAQAWGVERSAVEAKQGVLKSGNHTGTYAEFATAASKVKLDKEPAIKTLAQWTLLGKPTQRIDIPHKV